MTLRLALLAVVGAAATACGPGGATLRTDAQSYAPGSCVSIFVKNESLSEFEVDHCAPTLERQIGDAWMSEPATDQFCLLWGMGVGPLRESGFQRLLPTAFAPGTYRYQVEIDGRQQVWTEPSPPFEVSGEAVTAPDCDTSGPIAP